MEAFEDVEELERYCPEMIRFWVMRLYIRRSVPGRPWLPRDAVTLIISFLFNSWRRPYFPSPRQLVEKQRLIQEGIEYASNQECLKCVVNAKLPGGEKRVHFQHCATGRFSRDWFECNGSWPPDFHANPNYDHYIVQEGRVNYYSHRNCIWIMNNMAKFVYGKSLPGCGYCGTHGAEYFVSGNICRSCSHHLCHCVNPQPVWRDPREDYEYEY